MLSRTRRILTKDPVQKNENFPFFSQYDEDDSTKMTTGVYFDRQSWVDMGAPETITVQIEYGDTLNQEEK